MKSLVSITFALMLAHSSLAQKVYFIYLQTENNSPFYAKMSDKVFSSSNAGYLTLSNLFDSTYSIAIGFPSGKSETRFSVPINSRDRGFLIRNSEGSLLLVDIETSSIIKPVAGISKGGTSYELKTDLFTTLLAKAAGDSSLLYVAVKQDNEPKKEEKINVAVKEEDKKSKEQPKEKVPEIKSEPITVKTEAKELEIKKDSVTTTASVLETPKKDSALAIRRNEPQLKDQVQKIEKLPVDSSVNIPEVTEYKRSTVKKYSESSTSEGFGLVFFDIRDGSIDTIRLTIPNPKFQYKLEEPETKADDLKKEEVKKEQKTADVKQPIIASTEEKKNAVIIASSTDSSKLGKDNTSETGNVSILKKVKPSCPIMVSEAEFLKLRRNMVAKSNDEGMVNEAKKTFRNRCLTTDQIKSLASLFLTSAGKYEFFSAAYPHVSDQEKFASLQSEIKDDYYFKRFKSLVGE
jgi:hypothetical protein